MGKSIFKIVLFLNLPGLLFSTNIISELKTHPTYTMRNAVFRDIVLNPCKILEVESTINSLKPIAGTVSHHMLASGYIDSWFKILKNKRDIDTFIIISPNHFNQGISEVSLSSISWDSGLGIVEVDQTTLKKIKLALQIEKDDNDAFYYEHGIGTIVPFIKKYFPKSKIVPILNKEKGLNIKRLNILSDSISNLLNDNKNIFIIISTDFSHHYDQNKTEENDKQSESFLLNPLLENIIYPRNDNIGGLYVLAKVLEGVGSNISEILYHSNSYKISAEEPTNITSYFFTLFY